MAYDYLWTPSIARPTADSTVKIENWDGKPVTTATFTFSSRQILVTVQEKGRYKLSIRSGSQAESTTVDIPAVPPLPNLYERLNTLESRPSKPDQASVEEAMVKIQKAYIVYSDVAPTATTYTAPDGTVYPVVWVAPDGTV